MKQITAMIQPHLLTKVWNTRCMRVENALHALPHVAAVREATEMPRTSTGERGDNAV
jgi:hypothetical protein